MQDVTIYLEVFGLAIDENGNKANAGMQIKVGESEETVDYERIKNAFSKKAILNLLPKYITEDDIKFIYPEEYKNKYLTEECECD